MARLSKDTGFDGEPLVICDCNHKLSYHALHLIGHGAAKRREWRCTYIRCKCRLSAAEMTEMREKARCAA